MMDIILPPAGKGPGVVVAHAWWGLNQTVRDYAAALAAQGFVVGVPDLFDGKVAATIDEAQANADTDWSPNAGERLRAAIAELVAHPEVMGDSVGAVGFSYSGWWLLNLAAKEAEGLGAVVIHYATGDAGSGAVPVMAHLAGADPFESDADMAALLAQLPADAGFQYEGTTHWFAEADRPEYVEAAAKLAFERTVAFLKAKLATT